MADELQILEDWVAPLLAKMTPAEIMTVAVVAARAKRPMRSEVRFFSPATEARSPVNEVSHSGSWVRR